MESHHNAYNVWPIGSVGVYHTCSTQAICGDRICHTCHSSPRRGRYNQVVIRLFFLLNCLYWRHTYTLNCYLDCWLCHCNFIRQEECMFGGQMFMNGCDLILSFFQRLFKLICCCLRFSAWLRFSQPSGTYLWFIQCDLYNECSNEFFDGDFEVASVLSWR